MSDPWSMGGYGAYVWTCYALTFTVVAVCFLQGRQRLRKVREEIRARLVATDPGDGG